MTILKHNSRTARTLIWAFMILTFVSNGYLAQDPPTIKKKTRSVRRDDLAIAEFIDGGFLVIGLNGSIRQFNLRPKNFFMTSRFSADGKHLVGFSKQGFIVLNQDFELVWERPSQERNVASLALSPDGAKIVFAAADPQMHTVSLSIVTYTGPEEVLETFPVGHDADVSRVLSWDPTSRRVVYGEKGMVRILDLQTRTSKAIKAGFDPMWSPSGRWIAYRSAEGRIRLLEVSSGIDKSTNEHASISSMVHWAPDSNQFFVDEKHVDHSRECFGDSRFVVYGISDDTRRVVYNPCGLRDWYFGWISNATRWIRAAQTIELELKRESGKTSANDR